MNVEQFLERFLGLLYVSEGWETPLTMERLHQLLQQTLDEYHREIYS